MPCGFISHWVPLLSLRSDNRCPEAPFNVSVFEIVVVLALLNVSVAALSKSETAKANAIPLVELTYDQRAEIVVLDEAVQGFTRRRFLDLGLTPGTMIYPELHNFFGDPRAYRVRGTLIALRKDQAAQIWVKPV